VASIEQLEELYGSSSTVVSEKETRVITPLQGRYIEESPFVILATAGLPQEGGGLDCSPRGDPAGFVRIADERTLQMPDRRGNNRLDTLRNLVRDPRIALLFLIPGVGEALRVNGSARISALPALCKEFSVDGKAPASVLVISVSSVFFQCARAIKRSGLWDPARHLEDGTLPSPGAILQALSAAGIDGPAYDAALQARQAATLY